MFLRRHSTFNKEDNQMGTTELIRKGLENGYAAEIAQKFKVLIDGMAINAGSADSNFRKGLELAQSAFEEAMSALGIKVETKELTRKGLENGYTAEIAQKFKVLIEGMAGNDGSAGSSFRRGLELAQKAYQAAIEAARL
jgi:hypothetical protein